MGVKSYKIGCLDFNIIAGAYFIDNYNCCKQTVNGDYVKMNCNNVDYCSDVPYSFDEKYGLSIEDMKGKLCFSVSYYNICDNYDYGYITNNYDSFKIKNCNCDEIYFVPGQDSNLFCFKSIIDDFKIQPSDLDWIFNCYLYFIGVEITSADIQYSELYLKNIKQKNDGNVLFSAIYTNQNVCIDNYQCNNSCYTELQLGGGFNKCHISNSKFNTLVINTKNIYS